ncbi:hypothetical protein [Campylobacter sp.]|uniref:hypothetical protein n=1 Tax=Campylobacter sp. TaxID=205 RepID=UPI002A7ECF50|nr:hypothetical protein [Campylobacter sp.]MDY4153615.1 hypothetical protein [Campylobacter sp.]
MNGIVIKQIDNGQNINFDEIVAFAKKLFDNKISIEKIEGESLNADTMSAIDELMSGGGISCQSFDGYKRKINE